ncbi:MAG: substrate-binding domain-containing protein [Anaerolineae bacterium]|nr:substrate-binding domain-containing protein [Anaerolineae bacterium]
MLLIPFTPVAGQVGRWDGADDQPVSPLACPGDTPTRPALGGTAYNGGQPANAPELSGQPITIVDIRKSISAGYDREVEKGMQSAAGELGNVEVLSGTSSIVSVGQQAAAIDEYMFGGVHGMLFAAVDQKLDLASSLRAALDAGIHVVGYESDVEPGAREWFVKPAEANAIAKTLIDQVANQSGPRATFAVLTSTYDSPDAARWISEMWAYTQQCYPGMEWLETAETQDDPTIAYNQSAVLLSDYGSDLTAIISLPVTATPNTSEAVTKAGKCGSVAVAGLATPNAMKPYINSGCVQNAVLWEPVDLGYAAVYVMRAAADGSLQPGSSTVDAGRLGALPVVNGSEILLGAPLIFSAQNINDFDF